MSRSKRDLYVGALDVLLRGKMAAVARARDWEMLREVARLAQQDAPRDLAVTDPALFGSFRNAVTRYHVGGWGHMTPERVDMVSSRRREFSMAGSAPQVPGDAAETVAILTM